MSANKFTAVFLICFTSLFLTGATGVVLAFKNNSGQTTAKEQVVKSISSPPLLEKEDAYQKRIKNLKATVSKNLELKAFNNQKDKIFNNNFSKIPLHSKGKKEKRTDVYKSPNPLVIRYIENKKGFPKKEDLNYIARIYSLPENLLYAIMMKESKGNQYAISYKQAKGAFQFMYPTAVEFGLFKNGIDYRADPWRSADAAARYIKWLYVNLTPEMDPKDYSSYKYALAAYNAGIKRVYQNGDVVIPNIKETQDYVSKIIGYLNGEKYLVKKGDRLKDIAKQYDISPEKLKLLNNGLDSRNLKYGKFISIKPMYEEKDKYIVKSGDTLKRIAKLTDTDLYSIRKRNGIEGDIIYAGQTIYIP